MKKLYYRFLFAGGSNPMFGNLPVYDVRECVKENFSPMAWNLINPEKTIQVLIDSIGGKAWININRYELIEVEE